ncbi:MAG: hypothetical protein KC656_22980, partial [Myxococcales bacterium]|nr:hypothetical protein [Myxococcales bacterium]
MTPIVLSAALAATISVPGGQPNVQAAVDAASNGDTIVVGPGVHVGSFVIDKPLTLRGAGAGTTILESDSDSVLARVSFAGPVVIEDLTLDGAGTGRVLRTQNPGAEVRVTRVDLRGGAPGNDVEGDYGVTCLFQDGSVVLTDVSMTDPSVTLPSAPWSGGSKIIGWSAEITLIRAELANGTSADSGMIGTDNGSLTIIDSHLHDGTLRSGGGGAASVWRTPTYVEGSVFEGFECLSNDCWGGVLDIGEADLVVVGSHFGSVTGMEGAGHIYAPQSLDVSGSYFHDATTRWSGG